MNHLDKISVEELQDILNNVEGNKSTQRLLAAIAHKNGVAQTELAEWYGTGRRTSTAGSRDSIPMSRLNKPLLMISKLGESKNFRNNSKKRSRTLCTTHPRKLGLTSGVDARARSGISQRNILHRVLLSQLPTVAHRSGVEMSETTPLSR